MGGTTPIFFFKNNLLIKWLKTASIPSPVLADVGIISILFFSPNSFITSLDITLSDSISILFSAITNSVSGSIFCLQS